jgi:hypothetical protein
MAVVNINVKTSYETNLAALRGDRDTLIQLCRSYSRRHAGAFSASPDNEHACSSSRHKFIKYLLYGTSVHVSE